MPNPEDFMWLNLRPTERAEPDDKDILDDYACPLCEGQGEVCHPCIIVNGKNICECGAEGEMATCPECDGSGNAED